MHQHPVVADLEAAILLYASSMCIIKPPPDGWSVVQNDALGRPLIKLLLDDGFPPFYFYWSSCGNYLAMLSNWFGRRVALRVLDVAAALVPGGMAPRLAFVGAGVPLYFSWAPHAPKLYIHTNSTDFCTWDTTSGAAAGRSLVVVGSRLGGRRGGGGGGGGVKEWNAAIRATS
eukprot:jgi/Chrzof1/896/Cz01g32310.t1